MKNKNGFIASSLMFSFFLVFVLLCVLVLTSYTHYNTLIKNLNGNILIDLNTKIKAKYSSVKSVIRNGNIEGSVSSSWYLVNANKPHSNANNNFLSIKPNTSGSIAQSFTAIGANRKIYVSFNFNTWYRDPCTNCTFTVKLNDSVIGSFYFYDGQKNNKFDEYSTNTMVNNTDDSTNNHVVNWVKFGKILNTTSSVNTIIFEASNLNYDSDNGDSKFGINDIVVADVTNLFLKDSSGNYITSDIDMVRYLLVQLPYIDYNVNYKLPKK